MRIQELTLYTTKLELEKAFYSKTLGFPLVHETTTSFTIKVGWSELTFKTSQQEFSYHYCFLIPSNQLMEAMKWMEERIDLIDIEDGRKIQHFESWNADSFYFYDASGNIAEFIVRYDLKNQSTTDFTISDVLCVNEIGMPTTNVQQTNALLQTSCNTEFWKGDIKRFGTHGDQEGLFLLPNFHIKEIWFPTSIRIVPNPFEAIIENNGKTYSMKFKHEEITFSNEES